MKSPSKETLEYLASMFEVLDDDEAAALSELLTKVGALRVCCGFELWQDEACSCCELLADENADRVRRAAEEAREPAGVGVGVGYK